jgi:hypothetical protein
MMERRFAGTVWSDAGRRTMFFATLLLVTAIPLFGLGFALPLSHRSQPHFPALLAAMFPIIAATGIGHVASTAYLYLDHGFWRLIRENWPRFFVWPMLAIAVFLGAYEISPGAAIMSMLAFGAWQLHHYQRQNFGVIAFAAQSTKFGPLPGLLRWVLDFGTAGCVCGSLSNLAAASGHAPGSPTLPIVLHDAAIACFAVSTGLLATMLARNPRLLQARLVLAFVILSWAFFLPVLMCNDILVSIQSFAIGHGAQYLVFLTVVSGASRYRWIGPLLMATVTFAAWQVLSRLSASPAGLAIYTGLVAGHFMIDAKVWRMRDPLQRSLIRERFGFLFA